MRLSRDFFKRDTLTVARELIGCKLVHETPKVKISGIIVETEAYLGPADAASHSYKGKTDRVRALYDDKGLAYIYLIYGMYNCFNISTGDSPAPECVLIRALEPVPPYDLMIENRGTDKTYNLCSGPGKLCIALKIDRTLYGTDLCSSSSPLYVEAFREYETESSRRINVDYAGEAADYLYRFTAKGNRFLSKKP